MSSYGWALAGGVVWNLANILFLSALDIAGMAVAYPLAIGTALVEGVLINYIAEPKGNPAMVFGGVALVALAIVLDGLVYRNVQKGTGAQGGLAKGISLALGGGILMGLFFYLTVRAASPDFVHLTPGRFGPYAAVLVNTVGAFLSNFVLNTYMMRRPIKGPSATYSEYFKSPLTSFHAVGIIGGIINAIGFTASFVASKVASPAIAYGLGQGATMIAAIWGIFIWKETKGASRSTQWMIAAMFVCFLSGLIMLVSSMAH
jgi:glucose uptake protein